MIPLLDHGYVKLIGHYGTEETVIESARMSTGKGFEGWDKDARLLEFLYRNGHMSPFEMCDLTVEVQSPIFVVREWQRHRTFSYNELSARYARMPDLHYVPTKERVAKQSSTNKQSSGGALCETEANEFRAAIQEQQERIYEYYTDAMNHLGVAREIARINTPVSRYTRMRVKGNLRNWLQFLALRLPENAQYEIRVYAEAVASIVKELWPRTYELFEEWTLGAVTLSRSEARKIGLS
jgi:thymidylate synthase (FAD)